MTGQALPCRLIGLGNHPAFFGASKRSDPRPLWWALRCSVPYVLLLGSHDLQRFAHDFTQIAFAALCKPEDDLSQASLPVLNHGCVVVARNVVPNFLKSLVKQLPPLGIRGRRRIEMIAHHYVLLGTVKLALGGTTRRRAECDATLGGMRWRH